MSSTNPFLNQTLHDVELKDVVVMRGKVLVDAGVAVDRIHLVRDDHQPNIALRFIKGYIFQNAEDGIFSNEAIACKLTTSPTVAASFDASDYNQIAWITSGRSTPQLGNKDLNDIIDPTNIISHDLYAEFWNEATYNLDVNYMFIFQRVNLDDIGALLVSLDNYLT